MEEIMAQPHVHAPRPWLKPVAPCLVCAHDALVDTHLLPYEALNAQVVNGEVRSVGRDDDRSTEVFVGNHESNGQTGIVQLETDSSKTDSYHGDSATGSSRRCEDKVERPYRSLTASDRGSLKSDYSGRFRPLQKM